MTKEKGEEERRKRKKETKKSFQHHLPFISFLILEDLEMGVGHMGHVEGGGGCFYPVYSPNFILLVPSHVVS